MGSLGKLVMIAFTSFTLSKLAWVFWRFRLLMWLVMFSRFLLQIFFQYPEKWRRLLGFWFFINV